MLLNINITPFTERLHRLVNITQSVFKPFLRHSCHISFALLHLCSPSSLLSLFLTLSASVSLLTFLFYFLLFLCNFFDKISEQDANSIANCLGHFFCLNSSKNSNKHHTNSQTNTHTLAHSHLVDGAKTEIVLRDFRREENGQSICDNRAIINCRTFVRFLHPTFVPKVVVMFSFLPFSDILYVFFLFQHFQRRNSEYF